MKQKVVILRDDTIDLLEDAKSKILKDSVSPNITYDKVVKKALEDFLE